MVLSFLITKGQYFKISKNEILENDIYSNFERNNYKKIGYNKNYILKDILFRNNNSLQDTSYLKKIKVAEAYYTKKKYSIAAQLFSKAIYANKNSGRIDDRIKLACSFAMINQNDSAFVQLFRIATLGKYSKLTEIESENNLTNLHIDKRWKEFISIVVENRNKILGEYNKQFDQK